MENNKKEYTREDMEFCYNTAARAGKMQEVGLEVDKGFEEYMRTHHKPKQTFEINTILHTKDGRQIGNAIIIGKDGEYNIIKTDYGNECRLTDGELEEAFYIAYTDFTPRDLELLEEKHKNHVEK